MWGEPFCSFWSIVVCTLQLSHGCFFCPVTFLLWNYEQWALFMKLFVFFLYSAFLFLMTTQSALQYHSPIHTHSYSASNSSIFFLWGAIRGSASCTRTLRHADGEDCQPSGWRMTSISLSHSCPLWPHKMWLECDILRSAWGNVFSFCKSIHLNACTQKTISENWVRTFSTFFPLHIHNTAGGSAQTCSQH